jgi:hypothetical protein
MRLVLELSPALAAIYTQLPPRLALDLDDEPIPLAQALKMAGIQPLLVLKGMVQGNPLELGGMITEDCEIKLISPLSGG